MHKRVIQIIIIGVLNLPILALAAGIVQLPVTGQTTCYDANGGVIACPGSGQDGDTQTAGVAWPTPRFIDNNNGTMTDNLTKLVWSKHANAPELALGLNFCTPATPGPEVDMTWPQSFDYIKCLNGFNNGIGYLGFNDWRLPNVNELESLVNAEAADTAISFLTPAGFIQAQSSQYWSSTTDASNLNVTTNAWDIDLAKGQSLSSVKTDAIVTKAVWPVRGVSAGPARIWRTGQDLCFNLTGTTTTCTGTGQDGEKQAGAIWPAPRFKANLDNTYVLDRVTGLIWTQDTNTPGPLGGVCTGTGAPAGLSWQNALNHAACLNSNNFLGLQPNPAVGNTGWRIPNRKELRSLVDYSRGGPALPAAHPFTGFVQFLRWSSTTDAFLPSQAWTVNLLDSTLSGNSKTGTLPAWPVSGPDLVAPALSITQGNITANAATQTISGSVEAGATVTVANNGGTPAAASVTGTSWTFTTDVLANGVNNIVVTAADFSENITSASISITVDTLAPALVLSQLTAATNLSSQTIGGTVEALATMAVTLNGATVPASVVGTTWSSVISGLVPGVNNLIVTATDALQNVAIQNATITFIVPDGLLTGGNSVTISDALMALRITVGLVTPTANELLRGDVEPPGAPNGTINLGDALLILRKVVGLPSF
jgi:hypothetical protein